MYLSNSHQKIDKANEYEIKCTHVKTVLISIRTNAVPWLNLYISNIILLKYLPYFGHKFLSKNRLNPNIILKVDGYTTIRNTCDSLY